MLTSHKKILEDLKSVKGDAIGIKIYKRSDHIELVVDAADELAPTAFHSETYKLETDRAIIDTCDIIHGWLSSWFDWGKK